MNSINEEYEKALEALKSNYTTITQFKNIISTGVGFKIKNNKYTDQVCIYVVVNQKLEISKLNKDQVIPTLIANVPTDVVENKEAIPLTLEIDPSELDSLQEDAPLQGGILVTNGILNEEGKVAVGTLGAFTQVPDNESTFNALLSNHHVLYANGATNDDPLYHPSISNRIGFNYIGIINNNVDGGLGKIDPQIEISNNVIGIGTLVGFGMPALGENVRKYGITTKLTTGQITKIGLSLVKSNFISTDIEIISSDPTKLFADHGDSGAVIVNNENEVVGLLDAGIEGTNIVTANNIQLVREALLGFNIPIPNLRIEETKKGSIT